MHDLHKYSLSKRVCKELPSVQKILDEFYNRLKPYKTYRDVGKVLKTINDSKQMINIHLQKYQKIKENKGDTDNV